MRKILLVFAVCVCSAVFAENIVLDLSNPGDFPIEYDESGLWADVFNNDAIVYSQEFMFSHASPYYVFARFSLFQLFKWILCQQGNCHIGIGRYR